MGDKRPVREVFLKGCKTPEEYQRAFREYRLAKKHWLEEQKKSPEWENDMRKKKRSRIYRKYKDSEFRKKQEEEKPQLKIKEYMKGSKC